MTDHVQLRNFTLPFPIPISDDAWHRNKPQPVIISVRVSYPSELVSRSGAEDDVNLTLNYGSLYRTIEAYVQDLGERNPLLDLDLICGTIARAGLDLLDNTLRDIGIKPEDAEGTALNEFESSIEVSLHLPKALLRVDGGLKYRSLVRRKGTSDIEHSRVESRIEDLRCPCVVGVNPHEKVEKQTVVATLVFDMSSGFECSIRAFQAAAKAVSEGIESSSFETVEALASHIGKIASQTTEFDNLTVTVEKPSALSFAEYSGVEMTRSREFFASLP